MPTPNLEYKKANTSKSSIREVKDIDIKETQKLEVSTKSKDASQNQPEVEIQIKEAEYGVKDKLQYSIALLVRILAYCPASMPYFLFSITYSSIVNSRNLNLEGESLNSFLAYGTSSYYVGITFGYFVSGLFGNFDTKKVQRTAMFLLMCAYILNMSSNIYIFVLSRFLQGLIGKSVDSVSFGWVYEISLPKQRQKFMNMFLVAYACTSILLTFFAVFDNGGVLFWRIIYGVPVFMLFVLLILDFFFVKDLTSVRFSLKKKGFEETLKMLEKVYEKKTAEEICKEFKEAIEITGSPGEKKLNSTSFWEDVKDNSVELKIAFLTSIAMSLTLFTAYSGFGILIGSRDLRDEADVKMSKIAVTMSFVFNTLVNFLNLAFNWNKNKKRQTTLGVSVFMICALLICLAYSFEIYLLAKISVALSGAGIALIFTGLMPYWTEILPSNLTGLPYGTIGAFSAISTFVFPKILKDGIGRNVFVLFFGVCFFVHLIGLIFGLAFVRNFTGMKKGEIRMALRGKLEKKEEVNKN